MGKTEKVEKIEIKNLFKGLQSQMIAQLSTNREFLKHPGTKGDSLENVWIEWLRKYLPNRYCVDKAIIIDSKGHLSHQIDLVIYDQQYTPFVFTQNGVSYIPAEGVYAIFEVKPELNKDYIEYAGDKVESVRRLYRTSAKIVDRGELKAGRNLTKILGGILTSETKIKDNTIMVHLKSLKGFKALDVGCTARGKSFYVDYKIDKDSKIENTNESIKNYYENRFVNDIVFSESDTALVTFFLQIIHYLQQRIGTVAAIDLAEYAKAINYKMDEEP